MIKGRNQLIAKKGWLFKGPDSGHESGVISFTKVCNYVNHNCNIYVDFANLTSS